DPTHLPAGTLWQTVDDPSAAYAVSGDVLPVITHAFAGPARPGQPSPSNAKGVIHVIARGVAWLAFMISPRDRY
ncbi:MAG: hypothetical protein WEC82_07130, partial [Xanthobacteraceae bacterium]